MSRHARRRSKSGRLGGAAIDVFDYEPIKAEAGKVFAGIPNVILTPHISGVTHKVQPPRELHDRGQRRARAEEGPMSTTTISATGLEALIAAALVASQYVAGPTPVRWRVRSRRPRSTARRVTASAACRATRRRRGPARSTAMRRRACARRGPAALMIDVAQRFRLSGHRLAIAAVAGAGGSQRHCRGRLHALASFRRRRAPCRAAGGGRAGGARLRQYAQGDRALGRQARRCSAPVRSRSRRRIADGRRSSSIWR